MTRLPSFALLALLALPAAAQDVAPAQFAYGTLIETTGGAALYSVRLPVAVYQRSTRADLADVRVFNAGAQPVPHAIRPQVVPDSQPPVAVALPVFPLPAVHGDNGPAAFDVRIQGGGALVSIRSATNDGAPADGGWLVDASALRTPIASLDLAFAGTAPLVARVNVEASDDLRAFRPVTANAPIVRTQVGGQQLAQLRVELGGVKAKYLRITGIGGALPATLQQVSAVPPPQAGIAAREHLVAAQSKADGSSHVFELDGAYPADRIGVELKEDNSVVSFEVEARTGDSGEWVQVARGTAYRLKQNGVTVTSPPLAVQPGAWRQWRLKTIGSASTAESPRLRLEWIPAELVFAARGSGPFMLAYGSGAIRTSAAMPIDTLIPGYGTDQAVEPAEATIGQNVQLAGTSALKPEADVKQWGLWGVMAAGALMLGMMAARLLRKQF